MYFSLYSLYSENTIKITLHYKGLSPYIHNQLRNPEKIISKWQKRVRLHDRAFGSDTDYRQLQMFHDHSPSQLLHTSP